MAKPLPTNSKPASGKPDSAVRVLVDAASVTASGSGQTGQSGGKQRFYYEMHDGALLVVRCGLPLAAIEGCIVDCLIGWDVPIGQSVEEQELRRTKITIFGVLEPACEDGEQHSHTEYDLALSAIRNKGAKGPRVPRPRARHVGAPYPLPTPTQKTR